MTGTESEIRQSEAHAAEFRQATGHPIYVGCVMYAELKRLGMDVTNIATYPEASVSTEPMLRRQWSPPR